MTTARERKIRRERKKQKQAKLDRLRRIMRNCIVTIGILLVVMAFDVAMVGILYENPYRSLEIIIVIASLGVAAWLFMKAFPENENVPFDAGHIAED